MFKNANVEWLVARMHGHLKINQEGKGSKNSQWYTVIHPWDKFPYLSIYVAASNEDLDQVEVEYITIPGWKSDITKVRKFEDLPPNAQTYVKKIEEIVQIPGKISCLIKKISCPPLPTFLVE